MMMMLISAVKRAKSAYGEMSAPAGKKCPLCVSGSKFTWRNVRSPQKKYCITW